MVIILLMVRGVLMFVCDWLVEGMVIMRVIDNEGNTNACL